MSSTSNIVKVPHDKMLDREREREIKKETVEGDQFRKRNLWIT